jgi:hypothetical protein
MRHLAEDSWLSLDFFGPRRHIEVCLARDASMFRSWRPALFLKSPSHSSGSCESDDVLMLNYYLRTGSRFRIDASPASSRLLSPAILRPETLPNLMCVSLYPDAHLNASILYRRTPLAPTQRGRTMTQVRQRLCSCIWM